MHGGVVATLIDTAANAAAVTVGAFAPGHAGRDGVDDGELHRSGPRPHRRRRDVHARGRRLCSVDVDVRDANGAPVATGLVVVKVSPP